MNNKNAFRKRNDADEKPMTSIMIGGNCLENEIVRIAHDEILTTFG